MLWLFDETGAQSAYISEVSSLVATERFSDHSELAAQLSPSAWAAVRAARYALLEGRQTLYVIERRVLVNKVPKGQAPYVDLRCREASALLHDRTIVPADPIQTWESVAPGAIVEDIVTGFTGARALHLAFGTGSALGTAITMQRTWKDAGEVVREVVAAAGLGWRVRLDGTTPTLDVLAPGTVAALIGDKHGTGSSGRFVIDETAWKNYAIALGRGEGVARTRVDVDVRVSGEPLKELVVDAKDIDPADLTTGEYEAALAARGAEKLAKTRRIEYGEATVSTRLEAGDLVYYDSGTWAAEMPVTEATEVREGRTVRYSATLGWREPPVADAVARAASTAADIS